MIDHISIIPITVVVAVSLFVLKEIFEGMRRYRGEARKKKVLRVLLARECKLNHWAIKSIKYIVETIREESVKDNRTKFTLIFSKSGKVLFRVKPVNDETATGVALAKVHSEVMHKNLLDVAMLDKKLFAAFEPAYDAVSQLQHIRDNLIYFVDPDDDQDKVHLNGFYHYALNELEDIHEKLNRLHIECTGEDLKKYCLRLGH
jgi:hypothetical protein